MNWDLYSTLGFFSASTAERPDDSWSLSFLWREKQTWPPLRTRADHQTVNPVYCKVSTLTQCSHVFSACRAFVTNVHYEITADGEKQDCPEGRQQMRQLTDAVATGVDGMLDNRFAPLVPTKPQAMLADVVTTFTLTLSDSLDPTALDDYRQALAKARDSFTPGKVCTSLFTSEHQLLLVLYILTLSRQKVHTFLLQKLRRTQLTLCCSTEALMRTGTWKILHLFIPIKLSLVWSLFHFWSSHLHFTAGWLCGIWRTISRLRPRTERRRDRSWTPRLRRGRHRATSKMSCKLLTSSSLVRLWDSVSFFALKDWQNNRTFTGFSCVSQQITCDFVSYFAGAPNTPLAGAFWVTFPEMVPEEMYQTIADAYLSGLGGEKISERIIWERNNLFTQYSTSVSKKYVVSLSNLFEFAVDGATAQTIYQEELVSPEG